MVKKKKSSPRKKTPAPRASRTHLTALAFAAVVLVLSCVYIMPYFPDDAYISFRYAENLVDGHGLAFNPGEPLEAYSNFLWIMVCALLYRLGMSLPVVTPFVGIVLALWGLAILWHLFRRRVEHPTQLFLPLLLYAAAGPFVLYVVSGMETALFGFLLLALLYYADRLNHSPAPSSWIGLTAIGFLLALARPEGVVVFPAAVAYVGWDWKEEGRPRVLRAAGVSLAAFVVAYAAYTAWRVGYFGQWLPTPFMSKGYEAFPLLIAWKKNLMQYFVSGSYFEAPVGYFFVALALLAGAGLMLSRERDAAARTDRLALFLAAVMSIAYFNFVDWMPAMRYHGPLVGLLCVPVARVQRALPAAWWSERRFGSVGLRLAVLVVLLMSAQGLHRLKYVAELMTQSRVECLIPLGEWIKEAVPPGSLVAIGDVGAVPYYSGMRTLDIHRESLTDRHIAESGFTVDYALARQPEVMALNVRGVYSSKMDPLHYQLYHHESFPLQYRFIGTVRHRWYLDRSYWVFIHESVDLRRDVLARFPTGVGNQFRLGFDLDKPDPFR